MLSVRNLSVKIAGLDIVDDVSFDVSPGEWLMVVGPNGAGKSTLVNALSGGVGFTGGAFFEGSSIASIRPAKLARLVGVLTQSHHVGYSFSVGEVVRMGMYSYSPGPFSARVADESAIVERAMKVCGVFDIREQSVLTLSGGELQRTFLAQLFAQDPKMLILDEPTNHLDLLYQKQIFSLITDWVRGSGRAVVAVVHDLSLARAYGTKALLLDRGRAAGFGEVKDVLSRENLARVYNMDVYGWMREMLCGWEQE